MKARKISSLICVFLSMWTLSNAQFADFHNYPITVTPHESADSTRGHFWGYMFGSYYTKVHADTSGGAGSGRGISQYSQVPKGANAFAFQRVYLGYDYFFNKQFSVHVVMSHEEYQDISFHNAGADQNYNRIFFLKYANMEWENFLNTHLRLTVGAQTTPAFAITEEPFWGYRSIDRTIMDMKSIVSSNDVGANIGGKIWSKKDDAGTEKACVGFNFMVGNSTGSVPDIVGITLDYTVWKRYYGDLYLKFLNDKLVLDLYGDGHTYSWANIPTTGPSGATTGREIHQYEITERLFLGYKAKNFNISVAYFQQLNKNMVSEVGEIGNQGVPIAGDTTDCTRTGFSVMAAAVLKRDKKTGDPEFSLFGMFDSYNPQTQYNPNILYQPGGAVVNSEQVNLVNSVTETYFVAGIDYQPIKQIHFMPNVWYNGIHDRSYDNVPTAWATEKNSYDLVLRITFYYQFFKN
jgi:hypothetical protein